MPHKTSESVGMSVLQRSTMESDAPRCKYGPRVTCGFLSKTSVGASTRSLEPAPVFQTPIATMFEPLIKAGSADALTSNHS